MNTSVLIYVGEESEEFNMIPSVVCFGDNCIDRYDQPEHREYIGGNAVNTAVHCRKAGCRTSYVGAIGNDRGGRMIIKKLAEMDIDVSHVQIFQEETAWTQVAFSPENERQFLYEYLGPRDRFELTPEVLAYIGQHSLIHNTWLGGTERFLPQFKLFDRLCVSMDFGERYSQEFLEICIPYVDLAFFSMDPDGFGAAEAFAWSMLKRGPQCVVVTGGKRGSIAVRDTGEVQYAAAVPVDVVDTLGAGDTYIGTFLAGFVHGKPLAECMEMAAVVAAHTCTFFGGFEGSEIIGD